MKLCTSCANVAINADFSSWDDEDDIAFIADQFALVGHLVHVESDGDDVFECDICEITGYSTVEIFERAVLH